MYAYIFYFFHKYYERTGDFSPRLSAVCGVSAAQLVHVLFVVGTLRFVFDIEVRPPRFSENSAVNTLSVLALVFAWVTLVSLYYNKKRAKVIVNAYNQLGEKLFSARRIIRLVAIVGIPLVLGMVFMDLTS